MMKVSRFILLPVLAALLLISCQKDQFVCEDEIECVEIKKGEAIKIAVLQPGSGRLMNSGTIQIRGIELALERRGGKIKEHPVELLFEDSQCSPEGGANAALKVVADPKIIGIIGPNCSGAGIEVSKIMTKAGLVMISGTNSESSLTSTDGVANENWNPGYFRTMYNSIGRAEAGAIYTYNSLGIKKAATIHDGDSRAIELTTKFEEVFNKLGGEIVLSTAIDRQDTNMRPVLERVADSGAGMIFYPFFAPETVYFTKQAREIEALSDTALMVCGSTMRTDDFISQVGEAGNGLYFLGKALLSGEVFEGLKRDYEESYDDLHDTNSYAFSFDAANILFNALESVIEEEKDGTLHIGRGKLREAMYNTRDHNGATGLLSSDSFGDCGTPKFNILQLKDYTSGTVDLLKNEVFFYIPPKGK